MRAIDTNAIVRYLTGDEREQAARARQEIEAGEIFVSTTVMLESEWVLRSVYDFSRGQVVAALRAFSGLPGVSLENQSLLAQAFDHAEAGLDLADALHLAAAEKCEALLTFDRTLIRLARNSRVPVTEPGQVIK